MASSTTSAKTPTKFAAALFPGFQALDLFGPLDALNVLSGSVEGMSLYMLSSTLDPVSTLVLPANNTSSSTSFPMSQSVLPTHTYETCPDDVEVLIVPGGKGCHEQAAVAHVAGFVRERYPRLRCLLTVCTGSGVAAQAGVLDGGRKATSNKNAISWIMTRYPDVQWQLSARWVVDGNIYTASGISAGIDMIYAFMADHYGPDVAERVARQSEYTRILDPSDDPFARE